MVKRLSIYCEKIPLPPTELYIGLGFNKTKEDRKRHYRKYYLDELEKTTEIMPRKPFIEEVIYREAP